MNQSRLKELLDYDQESGFFVWRRRVTGAHVKPGKAAGCRAPSGYIFITVDRRTYLAHRLAWLWMTGSWPRQQIDHRNLDKADNRWANLREATPSLNAQNRRSATNRSRTGLLGVQSPTSRPGKFKALIGLNGRYHYCGTFDTAAKAHAAYLVAKARLHAGVVNDGVIK